MVPEFLQKRQEQLEQVLDILLFPYSYIQSPYNRDAVTTMGTYPVVINYEMHNLPINDTFCPMEIILTMKYWEKTYAHGGKNNP